MKQIDMQCRGEVRRQPGEEQIKGVVVRAEAQGESPNLGLAEQVQQWSAFGGANLILGLRAAFGDEVALRCRQRRIFAGIAVKRVEQGEVQKTDDAGGHETQPPAEVQQE